MSPAVETLRQFRTLARDFRDAANRGDLPALDRILTRRRRLLQRMEAEPGADGAPQKADLLVAILEFDREAESLLGRHLTELEAELVTLERGRRGLRAYGGASRRPAKWIDEQG